MAPPNRVNTGNRPTPDQIRAMVRDAFDTPAMRSVTQGPVLSNDAQRALAQTRVPSSDELGAQGGLRLSTSPAIPRTAEGSIPLERDAIGKTLREGRARLQRRLAGGTGHRGSTLGSMPYAARLHRHVPRAPQPLRAANTHRAHQTQGTATTGRVHTANNANNSPDRGPITLGSRRNPLTLNQVRAKVNDGGIELNNDGTTTQKPGTLRNGDTVYYRNSRGIVLCGRVSINEQNHTFRLSPAFGQQDRAGRSRALTLDEAMRRSVED